MKCIPKAVCKKNDYKTYKPIKINSITEQIKQNKFSKKNGKSKTFFKVGWW